MPTDISVKVQGTTKHHKICPSARGQVILGYPEVQISVNEDKLHFQKKTKTTSTEQCGELPMCGGTALLYQDKGL